jgi:quercetin dioxygenase-like cupin family protein
METFLKSIAILPSEGKVLQVQPGETHVLKVVSADTDGAYTLSEVTVEPQVGPPAHLHRREDEAFYVLEGTFSFQVGDRTLTATAGWFLNVPRGIPHSFKNIGTTPARMLLFFVPAGIENFFEDLAKCNAVGTLDVDRIVAISNQYGIEIVP